ncbi:MAG: methylmalonyl-CoA epimerase [Thaumarchaeota archaeon]|nr:methylmalonyl-CoA epimerase [Nitrososphaerota archaeon]
MKIDHIGIAVDALDDALKLYRRVLKISKEEHVESSGEKVKTALLWFDNGMLELLEPVGNEGAVADFLKKRGPGLHHIAVSVENLDKALSEAAANGFLVVPPGPRKGILGNRVAFIHPKSLKGVLLELCEPAQKK